MLDHIHLCCSQSNESICVRRPGSWKNGSVRWHQNGKLRKWTVLLNVVFHTSTFTKSIKFIFSLAHEKRNHATRIWLNLFVVVAENFSYFSSPLIHIIFDATQYVSPLLLLLLPIEAEEAIRTLYFVFFSNSAVDSFEESDVSRSGGIKVGKINKCYCVNFRLLLYKLLS